MDMQNVSNLTIPEGQVRAIHDKNNNLLWGRVAYGVKYSGDSFQQTYTGKNLFNGTGWRSARVSSGYPTPSSSGGTIVTSGTNNIKFNASNTYDAVESGFIPVINGQKITFSTSTVKACNRFFITQYNTSKTRVSTLNSVITVVGTSTVTTTQDGYITVAFGNTTTGDGFEFENIQLELGTSATSYEPFVGSTSTQITPAPNPDYPQPIQVVTGEQTVTISDGVTSQTFTVDLGSTEFCKIGTYQDYIYKSGNDWYVHKENGSYTADGTEDVSIASTTPAMIYIRNNEALQGQSNTLMSTHFRYEWANKIGVCYVSSSGHKMACGVSGVDTVSAAQSWLSSNRPKFVYILATPTDTQITDTTLISQLDAVHEWLTRYGYNATVVGNLPIIIDKTNL